MVRQTTWACAILVIGVTAWYVARSPIGHAADNAAHSTTQPSGVAVVELFTSQGCSSCPPAEKVLADLSRAVTRDNRPVFTLAFHVDYWNRLGWADRFSDAAFSERQANYAKAFRLDEVYTPQMIVNGGKQFVGSERDRAERAINDALNAKPTAHVTVAVHGSAHDGYRVHATVAGADRKAVVNIAVVEQGLSTEVKSGENGGRHLEEPSVVRWFKTVPSANEIDVVIPALSEVRSDRASIVLYVQLPAQGAIVGAASAPLF